MIVLSLIPRDKVDQEITMLFEQGLTSKALSGNSWRLSAVMRPYFPQTMAFIW